MKFLITTLALSFGLSAWAATPDNLPGHVLVTDIEIDRDGNKHKLSTEVVIEESSREWQKLGALDGKTEVHGRIADVKNGNYKLEYKILEDQKGLINPIARFKTRDGQVAQAKVKGDDLAYKIQTSASSIFYVNE